MLLHTRAAAITHARTRERERVRVSLSCVHKTRSTASGSDVLSSASAVHVGSSWVEGLRAILATDVAARRHFVRREYEICSFITF